MEGGRRGGERREGGGRKGEGSIRGGVKEGRILFSTTNQKPKR